MLADIGLLGALERELEQARRELAPLVDRAEALGELVERAANVSSELRRRVSAEDLKAAAVQRGGERDLAYLVSLFDRAAPED